MGCFRFPTAACQPQTLSPERWRRGFATLRDDSPQLQRVPGACPVAFRDGATSWGLSCSLAVRRQTPRRPRSGHASALGYFRRFVPLRLCATFPLPFRGRLAAVAATAVLGLLAARSPLSSPPRASARNRHGCRLGRHVVPPDFRANPPHGGATTEEHRAKHSRRHR